jgi:hypothetical protein
MTSVLNGALAEDPQLNELYAEALSRPQLVLTDFGPAELAEFYRAEKVAFEIWKSMAVLRVLGKGGTLRVADAGERFWAERSDELADLIEIYDGRGSFEASATGTVFSVASPNKNERGTILLPQYNAAKLPWAKFARLFKVDIAPVTGLGTDVVTNFIWVPFDLLRFYKAHLPLGEAFYGAYGVSLGSVLAVVAALGSVALSDWGRRREMVWRYWQRAYVGPDNRALLLSTIRESLPAALEIVPLGLQPQQIDVDKAFAFWSDSDTMRSVIDVGVPGPHSVFLPCGDASYFTDYAWIIQRMFRLFHGLQMEDQNFKGDALEVLVRAGKSALPFKACKAQDGSNRQVDAAFDLGDVLLIAECRAKGTSIALERGDRPQSSSGRSSLKRLCATQMRRQFGSRTARLD